MRPQIGYRPWLQTVEGLLCYDSSVRPGGVGWVSIFSE